MRYKRSHSAERPAGLGHTLLQLALVAGLGLAVSMLLRSTMPIGTDVGQSAIAQEVIADAAGEGGGPSDPSADVTLVVFTDYQCAPCRASHRPMLDAARADGRVRIVYRHWPVFGPDSQRAARVSLAAAGQGIQPGLHHRLMTGRAVGDAQLRAAVESAGGNWARIVRDLSARGGEIDRTLQRTQDQAFGLGLGGTPGYLAGTILVRGALSEGEFRRLFRQARAR